MDSDSVSQETKEVVAAVTAKHELRTLAVVFFPSIPLHPCWWSSLSNTCYTGWSTSASFYNCRRVLVFCLVDGVLQGPSGS